MAGRAVPSLGGGGEALGRGSWASSEGEVRPDLTALLGWPKPRPRQAGRKRRMWVSGVEQIKSPADTLPWPKTERAGPGPGQGQGQDRRVETGPWRDALYPSFLCHGGPFTGWLGCGWSDSPHRGRDCIVGSALASSSPAQPWPDVQGSLLIPAREFLHPSLLPVGRPSPSCRPCSLPTQALDSPCPHPCPHPCCGLLPELFRKLGAGCLRAPNP